MALNKMNNLLNKIERRLGTKPLMLPDDICKDKWVDETIIPDTLLTFSRYFPHKVRIEIDTKDPSNKKGDYYVIDTNLLGGAEILGVRDIAWDVFRSISENLFRIRTVPTMASIDYVCTRILDVNNGNPGRFIKYRRTIARANNVSLPKVDKKDM